MAYGSRRTAARSSVSHGVGYAVTSGFSPSYSSIPAQQGRGTGNELLKRTIEHARKSKAVHKVLITFTFNRVSQGLAIISLILNAGGSSFCTLSQAKGLRIEGR
jgi:hypothetical protein